ncbi:MAG: hypothetical protein INR73_24870 [Williamsia sp.]|nr:hypothetical protein [Williamsia sp.]
MSNLAKRILSTFVEMDESPEKKPEQSAAAASLPRNTDAVTSTSTVVFASDKFKVYFDNLFKDTNFPGPDYFEFSRMIEAMSAIPDEKTRFVSAYAGLSLQGLDKDKLLKTANQYLQVIDSDAKNFQSTVDKALQEKVVGKKKEMEATAKRIQELSREINELNTKIEALNNDVRENEEKIHSNSNTYKQESDNMKNKILQDVQKINQYIS